MSNNRKPEDDASDSSAADEPTAMWDASALQGLGLEEAAKAHEEPVTPRATPARAEAKRAEPAAAAKPAVKKVAAAKGSQTTSWAMVIGLAVGVGVGVYALVRYLLS